MQMGLNDGKWLRKLWKCYQRLPENGSDDSFEVSVVLVLSSWQLVSSIDL